MVNPTLIPSNALNSENEWNFCLQGLLDLIDFSEGCQNTIEVGLTRLHSFIIGEFIDNSKKIIPFSEYFFS